MRASCAPLLLLAPLQGLGCGPTPATTTATTTATTGGITSASASASWTGTSETSETSESSTSGSSTTDDTDDTHGTDDTHDTDTHDTDDTTSAGFCGDGITQRGEECDDAGANSDTAACTSACVKNVCGDGLVLEGVEECDDSVLNGDGAVCTPACTINVCGDGKLLYDVEECDEGEANADSSACTTSCTKNVCGDGFVFEGVEECDDVDPQFSGGGDGCSAHCTREVVFFVSNDRFTGALGGRAGADELCAEAGAKSIKMPWPEDNNTIFRAWIADEECPVERRFPHTDRPYVRPDAMAFAYGWDDLVDGIPEWTVGVNEYGLYLDEAFNLRVWTALDGDGALVDDAAAQTCNFWTLSGDSFFGAIGRVDLGDLEWSLWRAEGLPVAQGCQKEAHLYCLQIHCDEHPEYCEPDYCAP